MFDRLLRKIAELYSNDPRVQRRLYGAPNMGKTQTLGRRNKHLEDSPVKYFDYMYLFRLRGTRKDSPTLSLAVFTRVPLVKQKNPELFKMYVNKIVDTVLRELEKSPENIRRGIYVEGFEGQGIIAVVYPAIQLVDLYRTEPGKVALTISLIEDMS